MNQTESSEKAHNDASLVLIYMLKNKRIKYNENGNYANVVTETDTMKMFYSSWKTVIMNSVQSRNRSDTTCIAIYARSQMLPKKEYWTKDHQKDNVTKQWMI